MRVRARSQDLVVHRSHDLMICLPRRAPTPTQGARAVPQAEVRNEPPETGGGNMVLEPR
jgi:hypothetical protein